MIIFQKDKLMVPLFVAIAIALGGCSNLSLNTIDTKPEGSLAAIPQNIVTTNLSDVVGGSSKGVATRSWDNGKFVHTIAASLPTPKPGEFYEGWLVRGKAGEVNFEFVSTGKLVGNKEEYDLKFESERDLTDHPSVVVTVEKVDDSLPEKHILEGSFAR